MNHGPTPYFRVYRPSPHASLRLFCFPYAGASASAFHSLALQLPEEIEVCGIEYPGRGSRVREKNAASLPLLVEDLAVQLAPFLNKPFAFFGYSMGALICYELARTLQEQNHQPEHVFLAAAGAPHAIRPKPLSSLPEHAFLCELKRLNGIPAEILADAELLRRALPVLRADFALCENYRTQRDAPLRCPLTVLAGQHDMHVTLPAIEAWSGYAGASFSSRIFPGGHFFLQTAQPALVRMLLEELSPLLRPCPRVKNVSDEKARGPGVSSGDKRSALARLLQARAVNAAAYPPSPVQQHLYLKQALEPGDGSSNINLVFHVRAELFVPGLTRALELLLERHPLLRSTFLEAGGRGTMVRESPAPEIHLRVHDLALPEKDRLEAVLALSHKQASAPMNLSTGPLYRFEVVRTAADEFFFLATIHAVAIDRHSVAILQKEIGEMYSAVLRQTDPVLPAPGAAFRDFADGKRQERNGALQGSAAYWKQRLQGAPSLLGGRYPSQETPRLTACASLTLGGTLTASLRSLDAKQAPAGTRGAAGEAVTLAAYLLLLHENNGATDIVVGATFPKRAERFAGVLGPFTQSLPCRVSLADNPAFTVLLDRVHAALLADGAHAGISLETLGLQDGAARHILPETGFSFQEKVRVSGDRSESDAIALVSGAGGFSQSHLHLDIMDSGTASQGWHVLAECNRYWPSGNMKQLLARFRGILEHASENPLLRLSELCGLARENRWRPAC